MQKAVLVDQAIVKDVEAEEFEYIDNQPMPAETPKMAVSDEMFEQLKENISTGDIDIQTVLDSYDLSGEQKAELDKL